MRQCVIFSTDKLFARYRGGALLTSYKDSKVITQVLDTKSSNSSLFFKDF